MDASRQLEEKCREFRVEGQVAQIHPGPVVTTFEFKPDAGVKYSKITGLADDLCLAMQAESVLIDRIPGKSTVGIQIPNPNRERSRCASCSSPTPTPIRVEADAGARQDHPRRAVSRRSRDDAAPADRRLHRHRQVGRLNAMLTSISLPGDARRRRMIMVDRNGSSSGCTRTSRTC
jgi:S-DNA-T family DNA segregation ATPase FtsK/SpoIIIE